MISEQLNFTPSGEHLRHAREREEYISRLKAYQVPGGPPSAASSPPVPSSGKGELAPGSAERPKKTLPFQSSDLVLIGALLLLLTDSDGVQDTVLLGILIYLLLG